MQERDVYRARLRALKRAGAAEEILELQEGLRRRLVEAERAVQRIEQALEPLPVLQRRVLYLRYVDGLAWREVSQKLGYAEATCYVLHRRALEALGGTV